MIRRAAVAATATLWLAACGDNGLPPTAEVAAFPAASRPDLDVLFLIDDTTTASFEAALGDAMPSVLAALSARPGGLPDLHIGFATSDLGTSGSLDPVHPAPSVGSGQPGGCEGAGKGGALQINGAPVSAAFVSDVQNSSGGRDVNYTGELATVLASIIKGAGVNGCGFEQSLAAVDAALANPANTGFRRAGAGLAIVVLSDEDDCSVRDAAFFDPAESGPLGPLDSFRCTLAGVTCDQALDTSGIKTGCRPSVGNAGLDRVDDLAAGVIAAEPDALRRAVAAIVAPATPFEVDLIAQGTPAPTLRLTPSCSSDTPHGFADPAVRTTAWARALGGQTYTICDGSQRYVAPLAKQLLAVVDGDPCIRTEVGAMPTCTVREDDTPIPACPATCASGACFDIVADPLACADAPGEHRVAITRTMPASPDATIHVTCELPSP